VQVLTLGAALAVAFIIIAVTNVIGSRANLRRARRIVRLLEATFRPDEARYSRVGGNNGYHFLYETGTTFGLVEGTLTFLPRESLIYLPFALLAHRRDQLRIVVRCDSTPPGQGRIVEARRLQSGWLPFEEVEHLNPTSRSRDGRDFLLLWYNPIVRDWLAEAVDRIPDVSLLQQIAYNGTDHTFLIEIEPRKQMLRSTLEFFASRIASFSAERSSRTACL